MQKGFLRTLMIIIILTLNSYLTYLHPPSIDCPAYIGYILILFAGRGNTCNYINYIYKSLRSTLLEMILFPGLRL